jgi:cobyrinic acid a,c-diamide synthase
MVTIPRIVIAAPGSGHGKTSIATGLLAAMRRRGMAVSPHKVGPDYIDPSYHTLAAGRPGRNLDPWLVGEDRIRPLFLHGARTPTIADIAVIEGVMGLFDGAGEHGDFASTAHVARLLSAPIVLVVDASGVSSSVAALVHGFASYDPRVRLAGVIFNQVGSDYHAHLLRTAVEPIGVPVLGVVHRQDALTVPSRHLGLIPAAERATQAQAAVDALAAVIDAGVDFDAVLRIAASAADLPDDPGAEPPGSQREARLRTGESAVRIAMAAGAAFTFGYAEHPELLAAAGAEVIGFDPLRDETLPPDVDAVVIGGGFPEIHAAELSANQALRGGVSAAAVAGAPVVAECAGLLYLARTLDGMPMCGVLDIDTGMSERLTLGYREAVAASDSAIAVTGARVRGHEFHRTTVSATALPANAWIWSARGATVTEGFVRGNVHASYLHTHWSGSPGTPERLVGAARRYRATRTGGAAR